MANDTPKVDIIAANPTNIDNVKSSIKAINDGLAELADCGVDALMLAAGPLLVGDAHSVLTQTEARYRYLINRMKALVLELNPNGEISYINETITKLTGSSVEALLGSHFLNLLLPFQASISQETLRQQFLESAELNDFRTTISTQNERQIILSWSSAHVFDPDGSIARIICFGTDVTEQIIAEQELRIAAIAFESQSGMILTDAKGIILRVNRAFTKLTGYSANEVVGQSPRILRSGRHDKFFYQALWARLNAEGHWEGEIWNRSKDNRIYAELLSIATVTDVNGNITHYVGTYSDISQIKEAEAEIHRLAYYDPLTNLPNRRLLMDRLKQAIAASNRNKTHSALLFIDMDNFKILNDTRGHDYGDMLLTKVAEQLSQCIRESDTVARLGGDEFIIMIENLSGSVTEAANQAETLGNKVLATLNQTYLLKDYTHHSTSSIGITLFFNHQGAVEELIKNADIAMYQAKYAGRNTLRFFNPEMQAALEARVILEEEMRIALDKQQFRLYYQFQVNNLRQIVGAEVLIRWQHPLRQLVSPLEFISLAEETGQIVPIGKWVLEMACCQLKRWQADVNTRDLQLSVNVSARQFHQTDFVEEVCQLVKSYAINCKRLKLELTETLVIDDIEDTITKMNALKEVGVNFSMDDFGTGYSSLSYLTRLPLTELKIDQSFVRNIGVKPSDARIVQTIIDMAKNLEIEVIAEGVETEAQYSFLEQHGCKLYQGYLFGRPVPVELFEEIIYGRQDLFKS